MICECFVWPGLDGLPEFTALSDEELDENQADVAMDAAAAKRRCEFAGEVAALNAEGSER